MKFSVSSDWHFEFYDSMNMVKAMDQLNSLDVDLNIIAGDTHSNLLMRNYFEDEVKNSFMIKGNHDYYGDFLSNDVKTLDINGVSVLGCTLWTSFDNGNPMSKVGFSRYMMDAKYIKNQDLVEEIAKINAHNFELIMDTQPDIVVTHHCPTLRSIHPRFKDDIISNHYFSNDYEKYLEDTKIKYWVFGHTHWRHMYSIGNTTFVCNPRGYPGEVSGEYVPVTFEI